MARLAGLGERPTECRAAVTLKSQRTSQDAVKAWRGRAGCAESLDHRTARRGRKKMSVSVNVPDELYRRAAEVAASENISVDELFASAFEQRVLEFERLKERAARGSYEKFLRVMAKVPVVEPPDYDRL